MKIGTILSVRTVSARAQRPGHERAGLHFASFHCQALFLSWAPSAARPRHDATRKERCTARCGVGTEFLLRNTSGLRRGVPDYTDSLTASEG